MATESPRWLIMGKRYRLHFSVVFDLILFILASNEKTWIKSRMSSNFGQIGPPTTELAALERLKCCLHATRSFFFFFFFFIESSSKLLVTRTGIKARMNLISGRIRLATVCLWMTKISHFWTWISLIRDRTTDYGVSCPSASKKFPIE